MDNSEQNVILEGITSVSAIIKAVRAGTARRKIEKVYIETEKKKSEARRVAFLTAASKELGFPVSFLTKADIDAMASGHTHGGILCEVSGAVFPGTGALVPSGTGFSVLLEGAEDPYSLGHSIRSLYSCGASELVLPHRYPNGADGVLSKASAGCSELLPIYICDPCEAVRRYKEAGYTVAAAGIRDARDLCTCDIPFPLLLIIGGEKRGISSALSSLSDFNIKIPYERDFMGSLPTESAVSVFAYEMMRRNMTGLKK